MNDRVSRLLVAWLGGLSLLFSGCGSWMPEMTPFGAVSAPDYQRSLNGLGVHRRLWEAAGAKCLTPHKLSPLLENVQTIVLVGQTYAPPGIRARQWLEAWLARAPGRSVIYFGRDFNAEIYYRRRTLEQIDPAHLARAKTLLAMEEAREMSFRLPQLPESTFCGWFFLDISHPPQDVESFQGEWAEDLQLNALKSAGYWPVGTVLQPPDQSDWRKRLPSWIVATPPVNPLQSRNVVSSDPDGAVVRSVWRVDELDTAEAWENEISAAPQSELLLMGQDGLPLVFRLVSERFAESQLLVVANGAPLLNGSMVDDLHQHVGEQIIQACQPAERVALLAFDSSGILISQTPEKDNRLAGLESLTVWPLSAISMSAALLGIVICAALLPILGRPQRLVRRSVSDFGLHVEAIGSMLLKSRDVQYARRTIEKYFQRVRGDAPPEWLQQLDGLPSASVEDQPQDDNPPAAETTT